MENTLLSETTIAHSVASMTGDPHASVVRDPQGVFFAEWRERGEQRSAILPVRWLMLSLEDFEWYFRTTHLPKTNETAPTCACSWGTEDGKQVVTAMCGAHHDFVRKYMR